MFLKVNFLKVNVREIETWDVRNYLFVESGRVGGYSWGSYYRLREVVSFGKRGK